MGWEVGDGLRRCTLAPLCSTPDHFRKRAGKGHTQDNSFAGGAMQRQSAPPPGRPFLQLASARFATPLIGEAQWKLHLKLLVSRARVLLAARAAPPPPLGWLLAH